MKITFELDGLEELDKLKNFLCGNGGNENQCLDLPIGELRLSLRVNACLEAVGIKTIRDLTKRSKVDLLKSPNLGTKSVREITDALYNRGLSLSDRTVSA